MRVAGHFAREGVDGDFQPTDLNLAVGILEIDVVGYRLDSLGKGLLGLVEPA